MDMTETGTLIARARAALHLTQQELAERLGVTNKAVSKWERGVSVPDVGLIAPLCKILGLPLDRFLGEQNEATAANCLFVSNPGKEQGSVQPTSQTEILTIHPSPAGDSRINPFLFGHNLEHTRGCVNGGLSAQMLKNRKFAAKPYSNQGVVPDWIPIGERAFFTSDVSSYTRHTEPKKMKRFNELQAQMAQNYAKGSPCGIAQTGLVLEKGATYEMRTVTKVAIPLTLTVSLTDAAGKTCYAKTELSLLPDPEALWQTCSFTLTPDAADENASVRYTFTEYAAVTFGALSMMREGHFHGMRRDVIEEFKKMRPTVIRWPGGDFAGEYRWRDIFFPVDKRGPLQAYLENETQPFTHGYDFHEIDTDDFIALCREVGAEPFITINLVWDSPEDCADWVEYCNGSADTPYGKLRAERGHPEPYNVRYWSLGNEMGFAHMEGPSGPGAYAALAAPHAKAMTERCGSPKLELFSSGPYPDENWVRDSAKPLSDVAHYVSLHLYSRCKFDYSTEELAKKSAETMLSSYVWNRESIRSLRAMLGDGISISFDEWNFWYAWYRKTSALEGLYAAGMLHMMITEAPISDIGFGCYFQPINEGAITVTKTEASLTPMGQAFCVLSEHAGADLLKIDGVADCEAIASRKGDVITLTLLNTDLEKERVMRVNRCGEVSDATLYAAPDLLPGSEFVVSPLPVAMTENTAALTLPPCSMASVRILCKA